MKTFGLFTAWIFHVVLTGVLTGGNLYGVYMFLKAYPAIDHGLGDGWTSFWLMIALAYFVARMLSYEFVSRVILPWLDGKP